MLGMIALQRTEVTEQICCVKGYRIPTHVVDANEEKDKSDDKITNQRDQCPKVVPLELASLSTISQPEESRSNGERVNEKNAL